LCSEFRFAIIGSMSIREPPAWRRLHLERTLSASPERVFDAFADPEHLRQWWGPVGFTVASLRYEAAEGADYRIAMRPPEGDLFHIRGSFRAVEQPRRLVFTFNYEEPDPDDRETVVTVTFDPSETGTRLVLDQEPFTTAARWELHREGWTETLARLEHSLEPDCG
jgi:uncharacterized protein YndB with AHSA1/START domain